MKKTTPQKSKNSKKRENREESRVDSQPPTKKVRADKIDSVCIVIHIVI